MHSSADPGPSAPPFLELKGLTRRFGDRVAVDALSLTLHRGEILGLLGPNGAGKTTAFRLLIGMLRPDSGEVQVDGRPARMSDRSFRAMLGVVFQEPSLDKKLTGRQNLQLHASLQGVPAGDAGERITDLLELVQLSDRADEPVARYSGGMKRRLDVARVLLHDPEILLMDEPTVGLDEVTFRRVWERLHALCDSAGHAILLTTHRPEEAAHCDRLIVLDEGRVIATGSPAELVSRVRGDVVVIDADDPVPLADEIGERLGLQAVVSDGAVRIECERGHEQVPRIVESFPTGRIRSVALHRPDLADVFHKIAGRALHG